MLCEKMLAKDTTKEGCGKELDSELDVFLKRPLTQHLKSQSLLGFVIRSRQSLYIFAPSNQGKSFLFVFSKGNQLKLWRIPVRLGTGSSTMAQ